MNAIRAAGHKPQVQSKPLAEKSTACISECSCYDPPDPEKFKKTDDLVRDNLLQHLKPINGENNGCD